MAPQTHIPVAANVLGTIGTGKWKYVGAAFMRDTLILTIQVLWCVQLVPQIWTNWRTKKTEGLPASMMFLWALCGVPFGAYAFIQNFNIPIQIQPQMFMALCLVSWAQTLLYGSKWPAWRAAVAGVVMAGTFAGVEAALILTLRPIYNRGNETPALIVGIIASILLALGLLPPYVEMWKRRGRVVGINWIFLSMDWSGAVFSLMALVAQNTFDILGGVLYTVCACLELGIFFSHIVWRLRTRSLRKAARAEGKTFDDIAAEYRAADRPFKFAEREVDQRCTPAWWWARLRGRPLPTGGLDKDGCDTRTSGDEERGEAAMQSATVAMVTPIASVTNAKGYPAPALAPPRSPPVSLELHDVEKKE